MANCVYLLLSLLYLGIIRYAWRLPTQTDLQHRLLLLVLAALCYDNFISGVGFAIGAGPLLKFLNFFRFAFHVFMTPVLCYVALALARKMRVAVAQRTWPDIALWVLIGVFMISGFLHDIAPMDLVPHEQWGVVKYTHAQAAIPVTVIAINVVILCIAAYIWKITGWPWLFAASAAMFALAAIPVSKVGLLPGNVGELLLAAAFLAAQKKVTRCRGID